MIYSILFVILAALSYWYWRTRYIPAQVVRNLAAFDADGAADTLQRGFHSREMWRRLWPALACCVVPASPLAFVSWPAAGLAFLAMMALIGGVFARWFTPLLNEARTPTRPDITTWTASGASKSWPDAKAWNHAWRTVPGYDGPGGDDDETNAERQAAANAEMKSIILRTWLQCRIAATLLAAGAAWVAIAHNS